LEESLALTLPAAPARASLRGLAVAVVATLAVAAPAYAADPVGAVLDRTTGSQVEVPEAAQRAQNRLRHRLGARALLQQDPATGTPRIVAQLDGFLTPPSARSPDAIALDYVRDHASAFGLDANDIEGLELTSRERGPDGTVHLAWEQRSGGLPNVDGGLHAAVTSEGRLLNVRGGAIPDPDTAAPEPGVSATTAYATALPGAAAPPPASSPSGVQRTTEFAGGGRASLVRYLDEGAERVGWRLLIPAGSSAFYDAIVDARTGRLQRRINRVRFDATFRHFNVNPRAEGGAPTTDVRGGWLDSDTTLSGPYVHAISDLDDQISLAQTTPPFGLTRQPTSADEVAPTTPGLNPRWEHPVNLGFCGADLCSWNGASASNRTGNRKFSTAQLFWYANTFRDHLAKPPIGFAGAEALEGQNDRVLAQALDGARSTGIGFPDDNHLNNASMLTLPDGYGALLQVHLFAFGSSRYDGAMDAGLVYHEYTHGLSDRLVTDTQGFGAMTGPQPGALSEGISDFYALDYLTDEHTPDDPGVPGEVRLGNWLQEDPDATGPDGTVRTEGLDCPPGDAGPNDECPGTGTAGAGGYDYDDFAEVGDAPEIHLDGEIWAQTLWDLRTQLIEAHSGEADPEHPGEDVGLWRTRAYITEGLRLAPDNPTFLDMRNAIVQAAVDVHGDDDWDTIWQVFADRGMGWSASTEGPNDLDPFPADDLPPAPGDPDARGGAVGDVTDEAGAPVAGAQVAVAGHDSNATGLGATDLRATTDGNGHYVLPPVPSGSYPDLYVRKPGFQEMTTGLVVQAPLTTTTNFAPLRRDYASQPSGGSAGTPGPNYTEYGCGPTQAVDDIKGTVWSTDAGSPQDLIVDLGRSIDLREIRIDPRAGCGDDPGSSLAQYELAASDGAGQPFERIAGGIVGAADARGYVVLPLAGDIAGRRLLRLRAIAPRDPNSQFMDVSELEATGTPVTVSPPPTPTPSPSPTPTPTPTPGPGPVAKVTSLSGARLTADRKGLFKVKARFGDAAPVGRARITVSRKGKRLARASTPVRQGKTVTKTLRLSRKGRKVIRRGQTRKVKVQLRLPGGDKLTKTVKLTRKRR